jgi:hypothetical protein
MSIIFPLFGSNQQKDTDGYFREGSDLKRIKSESFEIDTIFSNVGSFFVDRKENLYIYSNQSGNIKKYIKNFRTGNHDLLAWTISGAFSGGSTGGSKLDIDSYPFTSDFESVAVDKHFNFYFRDTTDSFKLKKYSQGGQLIASTSSDIGEFAVNKDNIISFSGSTVTKSDLSGNSISSFTVTGNVVAVNSDRVFTFDNSDEIFIFDNDNDYKLTFGKIYSYDLTGSLVWSVDRIVSAYRNTNDSHPNSRIHRNTYYRFISLKNGNLLISAYGRSGTVGNPVYNPFYGHMLINSSGSILYITNTLRVTGTIDDHDSLNTFQSYHPTFVSLNSDASPLSEYLYTQGANSDRSRLNF